MPTRADRHMRAVKLAKDCAALGARVRTIHCVTGLPPREIQRLFFANPQAIPRGRPPASQDWYHSANLLFRADSSIFVATYRRLRITGFSAGDALVGAYRHYQTVCQTPHRISFDRAFDLASHMDGIWIATSSSFSILTCPTCNSEFLAAIGTVPASNVCPFCKLVQRYGTDPRVQSSFPTRPLLDLSEFQPDMVTLHNKNAGDGDSRVHSAALPGDKENPQAKND